MRSFATLCAGVSGDPVDLSTNQPAVSSSLCYDTEGPHKANDGDIPPQVDRYWLKWRYYFQEYSPAAPSAPASHRGLHHWVFLIDDAVNDYEEDAVAYGTPSVGKIRARLTARQLGLEDVPRVYHNLSLLVMTPHCHAPSCIREELWDADTNTLLCNVTA